MLGYDVILGDLEKRKLIKESGGWNSIPYPFDRFGKIFAGWEQGRSYCYTASSGIGKTKITKFLVIISVYRFCKKHNIKFKIKYFALEESATDFWLSFIAAILQSNYDNLVTIQKLKSLGDETLDKETLKQIKEIQPIINDMMNYIEIHDNIYNGFGIYQVVREYARNNGKFYFKGEQVDEGKLYDTYKANDPEEFVFVVTDHISLLSSESNFEQVKMSHWESIGYYTRHYSLKFFCKNFNYISVVVQQQEAAKEKKQFTNKGENIDEKLEPSLDGLANNKETQRDFDFVFGLFAPERYQITNYKGYDIGKLKDTARFLTVLKDRWYGTANTTIPLFMNGITNEFFELPKVSDMNDTKYAEFLKKVGK